MKERPILFSGAMVRAIMSGVKTQTRRVVKGQNELCFQPCLDSTDRNNPNNWLWPYRGGWYEALGRESFDGMNVRCRPCPYGETGDRLWVRETHFEARKWRHAPLFAAGPDFIYRADYEYRDELRSVIGCHHWKPSIFMKREASRITLEIVSVRVERLQDISEVDAVAEGIEVVNLPAGSTLAAKPDGRRMFRDYLTKGLVARPVSSYATLWASINGPESWALNPWVWVVEFKRL